MSCHFLLKNGKGSQLAEPRERQTGREQGNGRVGRERANKGRLQRTGEESANANDARTAKGRRGDGRVGNGKNPTNGRRSTRMKHQAPSRSGPAQAPAGLLQATSATKGPRGGGRAGRVVSCRQDLPDHDQEDSETKGSAPTSLFVDNTTSESGAYVRLIGQSRSPAGLQMSFLFRHWNSCFTLGACPHRVQRRRVCWPVCASLPMLNQKFI